MKNRKKIKVCGECGSRNIDVIIGDYCPSVFYCKSCGSRSIIEMPKSEAMKLPLKPEGFITRLVRKPSGIKKRWTNWDYLWISWVIILLLAAIYFTFS